MELKKTCDFKVVIGDSKKGKGKYYGLVADLGYTKKFLSFNPTEIAEMCGISTVDLIAMPNGEYII